MNLSKLPRSKGYAASKKRVGRGFGSGRGGHTSTRGSKGQKARNKVRRYFEGGQLPLTKRLPHFKSFQYRKKLHIEVQLSALLNLKVVREITPEVLVAEGLVPKIPPRGIKIIGKGTVKEAYHLKDLKVSAGVTRLIIEAGGSVQ